MSELTPLPPDVFEVLVEALATALAKEYAARREVTVGSPPGPGRPELERGPGRNVLCFPGGTTKEHLCRE